MLRGVDERHDPVAIENRQDGTVGTEDEAGDVLDDIEAAVGLPGTDRRVAGRARDVPRVECAGDVEQIESIAPGRDLNRLEPGCERVA